MFSDVRVQVPSLAPERAPRGALDFFPDKAVTSSGKAAAPCKNKRQTSAGMAELADALDSGSNGRKAVQVQVLLPAP